MMGKRNTIVVSSSDDEDEDFSLNFSYRKSKSNPRPSSVPCTKTKRAKKARFSYSCSRPSEKSTGFDEIKTFCEDFDDGFPGFKVPAGCGRSNKDLWVDKHKPRSLEELAVHKKKVEEVKVWFEERLRTARAAVHVFASHLRVAVCEWNTPTPTIWQEHVHNSNPDDTVKTSEPVVVKDEIEPVVDAEYLKEIEKARRDLRALISSKKCAPLMLRLAWHDVGTYDASATTKTGDLMARSGTNKSTNMKQIGD